MNLWMVLVVLVGAEAKMIIKEVKLGQNFTLNCSLEVEKTSWYMKIHSGLLSCITRNMAKDGKDTLYFVYNYVDKFITYGNNLQILNISQQDLRIYCCGLKPNGTTVKCHESYRLKTAETNHTSTDQNHNQTQNQDQDQDQIWAQWMVLTSFGLNAGLILVITGLVFKLLCLTRQKSTYDPAVLTNQTPETLDAAQYEEINLPEYRAPPPVNRPSECVYYKAQFPRPSH